jgi:ankyrin repeat protein
MRTPLHCAIQGKKRTAIKILLEAGAKTDIPDQAGKTAMDLVNTNPNDGLKEFILQTQLELMIAETQKKPAAASTQNSFSPPPLGD